MRSVIDKHKTIPRNKMITPLFHLKKQKQTKKNKQKKPKTDKSILYCHYFLVFSTSEKLNHL